MTPNEDLTGESKHTRITNISGNTGMGDHYDPNNKGTSGTSGSSKRLPSIKKINFKYHFKGKYPKPK